jgi:glycine cleavage system H lipoate-binding protein
VTVLLVLATFVLFLVIDHFYSKRPAVRPVMEVQPQPAATMTLQPNVVSGFVVPENLRYHPGHTWALAESPKLVRIGFDDFASRLMGKIEKITLPQRGQWVRQGQKIWSVERNGVKTDMVSPIEGVVTEINQAAAENPESARRDPYGDGWMLTVESPDAKLNFRNLLNGDLARWWMEEASTRLRSALQMPAGAFAQDGGVVVSDLGSGLTDEAWAQATREFFLG